VVGDIGSKTQWTSALRDVDNIVHAAARVEQRNVPAAAFAETNRAGTQVLAAAAARAGVRRFVLVSSVRVNGGENEGKSYAASDPPDPQGLYGDSKWEAELAVMRSCASATMQYAIVRAPLVYGPGVRANFLRLLRWIDRGYPLPFGSIRNRRSMVSVWNLADAIAHMLGSPAAANRTWMVSDGEDLSTPELVRRIAMAMGRPARLFATPPGLLRLVGSVAGKRPEIERLCGSLRVDANSTFEALGWIPQVNVDAGIAWTVDWYREVR
jgi:UDP-glucose 4-epimerase